MTLKQARVAVIGLGYVGMPLALALSRRVSTIGYDIDSSRVKQLKNGLDRNHEIDQAELQDAQCKFTDQLEDIRDCNVYIVTVPTPVDPNNNPDLDIVRAASSAIGSLLNKGDIVVYESTVYPGVTEDICGPILEKESGLVCGPDVFLGYSPERINPGDHEHTVDNITKVVAGQTEEITEFLAELYGSLNGGNIFKARNIKTAEASKAIENAQRDINVAFINEVAVVLNKLDLSAYDVLEAAGTKWNFLPFSPGLVGGHCIGVDPYYLAQCAINAGHQPRVILSGRKTNDEMGIFFAEQMDGMLKKIRAKNSGAANILLLGFTFKENINDIRNTRVIDIVRRLEGMGHKVDIHDPHAAPDAVKNEYGIELQAALPEGKTYDLMCLAVGHKAYRDMGVLNICALLKEGAIVYDIKGIWRGLTFAPPVTYRCL